MTVQSGFVTKIQILPVVAIIAALAFGMRFGDFIKQVSQTSVAYAQGTQVVPADQVVTPDVGALQQSGMEKTEPLSLPKEESPPENKLSDSAEPQKTDTEKTMVSEEKTDAVPVDTVVETTEKPEKTDDGTVTAVNTPEKSKTKEKIEWRDSLDTDFEYSDVQMELFEDLAQRRTDLDQRDTEMAMREALLKAAQQEMEQKFKELTSLRSEIEELLVVQTAEEKKRIISLVKIYEGMKPKDAARIFDTLDLDVLLQVLTQMSERKSAPILAAMEVDRARTVTIMLVEQKQLPEISNDLINQVQ